MDLEAQIAAYIAAQPGRKGGELRALHQRILRIAPECRLWFLDGRNDENRTVSNPNIGYGEQILNQAGGKTREFYRVGLSANTGGISLYIIGLDDRELLARVYGGRLGKARITGYCVKLRTLGDVDGDVLEEMIRFGLEAPR